MSGGNVIILCKTRWKQTLLIIGSSLRDEKEWDCKNSHMRHLKNGKLRSLNIIGRVNAPCPPHSSNGPPCDKTIKMKPIDVKSDSYAK